MSPSDSLRELLPSASALEALEEFWDDSKGSPQSPNRAGIGRAVWNLIAIHLHDELEKNNVLPMAALPADEGGVFDYYVRWKRAKNGVAGYSMGKVKHGEKEWDLPVYFLGSSMHEFKDNA